MGEVEKPDSLEQPRRVTEEASGDLCRMADDLGWLSDNCSRYVR